MKVGDIVEPKLFHDLAKREYGTGVIVKHAGPRYRGMYVFEVFFSRINRYMTFFEDELLTLKKAK